MMLILGDSGYIHFFTDRHPPIRQFYFYHLDKAGAALGEKYAEELVRAVESNAADMIVVDVPMWENSLLRNYPRHRQRFDAALIDHYELGEVFRSQHVYLKKS